MTPCHGRIARPMVLKVPRLFSSTVGVAALSFGTLVSLPAQEDLAPPSYVTGREFPLAVWMQDPRNAARYHAAGINLYVALAQGPTAEQLARLDAAHVRLICEQNSAGLAAKSSPVIVGWMHGDEPDRAPNGHATPPAAVRAAYLRMQTADPERPVLLNLSPGAVSNDFVQRRDRASHPEDYPQYVLGSDIVSFDLYPVTNPHPQVSGKLELIARGVGQLVRWAGPDRAVWTCLECTHISNEKLKPTPAQVRAEAWLAIIGGARGLIYFCHEFTPRLNEAAPLDDPEMLAAITEINRGIQSYAAILAEPSSPDVVRLPAGSPLAVLVKEHQGTRHIFAVNLTDKAVAGAFALTGLTAEVTHVFAVGQDDGPVITIDVQRDGEFHDDLGPYGVRHYVIKSQ